MTQFNPDGTPMRATKPWWSSRWPWLIGFSIILVAVGVFVGDPKGDAEDAQCVEQAVRYYKEIGSYPLLHDGRSADDLIDKKCSYNSTSFEFMDRPGRRL